MSKAEKLIAKAISTQSDAEALACLRKVRKLKYTPSPSSNPHQIKNIVTTKYRGYTAPELYGHAEYWCGEAKSCRREIEDLDKKISSQEGSLNFWKAVGIINTVIAVTLFIVVMV